MNPVNNSFIASNFRSIFIVKHIVLIMSSPIRLIVAIWLCAIALYLISPVEYPVNVRSDGWGFIIACILFFCLGVLFYQRKAMRFNCAEQYSLSDYKDINNIITWCSILGMIGCLSILYDKVFLSGLDYSLGITDVRYQREADAAIGIGSNSSFLTYLGFVLYSFSSVSWLLLLLYGDKVTMRGVLFGVISSLPIPAVATLFGGRGPIVQLLGLSVGALVLRVLSNQTALPAVRYLRPFLVAFILSTLIYNGYVTATRRQYSGLRDVSTQMTHLDVTYGIRPSEWYRKAIDDEILPSDVMLDVFSAFVYYTHALPTLQLVLEKSEDISLYYGQNQFNLAFVILERTIPTMSMRANANSELAELTGLFSSAWGMLFVDYGLIGSLIEVFILGWLSGMVYYKAQYRQSLLAKLLFCFVVMSILFSPLSAPFGIGNAALVFVSMILAQLFLLIRPRSQQLSNNLGAVQFSTFD